MRIPCPVIPDWPATVKYAIYQLSLVTNGEEFVSLYLGYIEFYNPQSYIQVRHLLPTAIWRICGTTRDEARHYILNISDAGFEPFEHGRFDSSGSHKALNRQFKIHRRYTPYK